MKKNILTILIIVAAVLLVYATNTTTKVKPLTSAERMHEAITMYADSFNVPLHIAFNVAAMETTYRGPEDSTYNHKRVSSAGAVGPMQIMPKYASWFAGFPVKRQELKDSIELNVWLSMKILAYQFSKHKDWKKALGAYNTGRPIINRYARTGVDPKYYASIWIH